MEALQEENEQLRAALSQREADYLRQEGENFLLTAQVQQLERQLQDATRDVQTSWSQLTSLQQQLEIWGGGRLPTKAEVERGKALLNAGRKGLRRLAGYDDRGAEPAPLTRGPAKVLMTPRGRPQSPSRPLSPPAKGMSSWGAASEELTRASAARTSPRIPGLGLKDLEKPVDKRPVIRSARTSLEGEATASAGPFSNGLSRSQSFRNAAANAACTRSDGALAAAATTAAVIAGLEEELALVRENFRRQRLFIMRVLRKSASAKDTVVTLKDDLTRKDVILHNLRHELQVQKQEAQQQLQQVELHMQQLQQQMHLQSLEHAQAVHELQRRLLEHQLQMAESVKAERSPEAIALEAVLRESGPPGV